MSPVRRRVFMGENQQPERVVQVGRAGCRQLSRRLTEVVGELIGVVGKIMVEIVQAVAQSVSESAGKVKPPEFVCQRNRFSAAGVHNVITAAAFCFSNRVRRFFCACSALPESSK